MAAHTAAISSSSMGWRVLRSTSETLPPSQNSMQIQSICFLARQPK